jgi:cation-transporting ATPase 13A3/4/5
MSTGDNINTAISVAKDCNLLENSDIYHLDLVKNELNSNILCCNLVDNYESNDEIRDSLNSLDNTDFNCIYNKSPRDERLRISNFSAEILSIETQSPAVNNNEENFINLCYNDNMKSRSDSKTQFQYNNMDEIIIDNIISLSKVNKKFRLATTGNVFEFLLKIRNKYINMKSPSLLCYDKLFRFILNNCLIYARMSPENKSSLIENLKGDDCKVLMCGDGANDCGALRAANVGVSLSIEEASIAAHFTSKKSDISCLKDLLIEGKAALVTTIQCFKFMMLYSVIQFISVTIMVILGTYLSDNQFLMSDLFLIFPLAFLISKTEAVDNLTSDKPIADLKSISIISSIILQSVLQFTCQYFSFLLLKFQKWYTPLTVNENTECIDPSYENSVN